MKTIYLVTSEDKNDPHPVQYVDKFYNKKKAVEMYRRDKKDNLRNVKLSKVIMR